MAGFLSALPGAASQGLIWGIMAIGVYITYKILDIADLTVDGSFCTGGAVFVVLFAGGVNVWAAMLAALLAGMLAGLATGVWKDQEEIRSQWTLDRRFTPQIEQERREALLAGWNRAVERAKGWEG